MIPEDIVHKNDKEIKIMHNKNLEGKEEPLATTGLAVDQQGSFFLNLKKKSKAH